METTNEIIELLLTESFPTKRTAILAADRLNSLSLSERETRAEIEQLRTENSHLINWWRDRYNDLVETLTDVTNGEKVTIDDNREFPLSNGAKALVKRIRPESPKHYMDPLTGKLLNSLTDVVSKQLKISKGESSD